MARDPKRIGRMIALLEAIWTKFPDLRLYQLLGNASGLSRDPYYHEDVELEAELLAFADKHGVHR